MASHKRSGLVENMAIGIREQLKEYGEHVEDLKKVLAQGGQRGAVRGEHDEAGSEDHEAATPEEDEKAVTEESWKSPLRRLDKLSTEEPKEALKNSLH